MTTIQSNFQRLCKSLPWLSCGFLLWQATVAAGASEAKLLGDVIQAIPDTLTLSSDGKRFAVVTFDARTKGRRVIVDGKPMGRTYDSIAQGTPIFSVNGGSVAFAAKLGTRCYVVHDGVESEGYPLVRDGWPLADLLFSPHGKYLAYKARVEGETLMVVHGEKLGPYEVTLDAEGNRLWGVWDFCFSQDGESFAYRAMVKGRMVFCTGRALPVKADPKKGPPPARLSFNPPCDTIGRGTPFAMPGIGPSAFAYIVGMGDKEHLAVWNGSEAVASGYYEMIARGSVVAPPTNPKGLDFVARKAGKLLAVIAAKEGKPYDDISPLMYAGKNRYAYTARKDRAYHMVVDGVEGAGYEGIHYPRTVFSPDGQTVAYAARAAKTSFVVVGTQEGPRFGIVDPESITFSPNSKKLAYIAGKAGKRWIMLDGKNDREFDEVSRARFSADSSHLGYWARKDLEHFVVIDGEVHGPFADVSPDSPAFSNDGKHHAFAVLQEGRWQVLLDGKAMGPACDGIESQLSFSADGAHLVYVGEFTDKGRDECSLVVDGKAGRAYDAIWTADAGRLFLEPMGLEYFAKKGLLVYRVTERW